jgi:uncharacterized membrane protein (Fun14 family)
MDSIVTYQTVLAIIWFLIGFGLGFAVLRFWKLLLAVVIIAVLLPFILGLAGMRTPFTSQDLVNAFINGLSILASMIASNQFASIGFLLGIVLGLITFILRSR